MFSSALSEDLLVQHQFYQNLSHNGMDNGVVFGYDACISHVWLINHHLNFELFLAYTQFPFISDTFRRIVGYLRKISDR